MTFALFSIHRPAWPALAAALACSVLVACSKPAPAPPPLRAVRTLTVAPANASLQREYPAEIRPRTESRLGFRVGGKLLRRQANLGDTVRAGQLLAQLDPADLRLGQDAARAALTAAEATLAQNEAELVRYRALRRQGFISAIELDRREAALTAARAQATQARAQASVQSHQADYANLLADNAGVVTGIDAEPGAVLAAGMTVLRLAPDGPRDAVFNVPEDQVGTLRALLGRTGALRLRLWADQPAPTPATVREVAAAADPLTRTFVVKADVGALRVRLGQSGSVLVDTPLAQPLLKLPLPAVFEHGGRSAVWLLDTKTMAVRVQAIEVAGAEGSQVLVAGGLQPGQVVVTAGVHALTPGQVVRHYQEPGQSAPGSASAASAARG